MKQTAFLGKNALECAGTYPPKEDSFLLAKAVTAQSGASVLDMGCGTGIQGINAAKQGASSILFVDVNEKALECSKSNAKKFGFEKKVKAVKSDLFENVLQKFDCIIFNPPYVPSSKIKWVDTDGGKKGREVLDRFLEQFPLHLHKKGKCFFLQSSLNGERKTVEKLSKQGLKHEVIERKRLFFEELIVFKCFNE